jgi:hypothetical protein
MGNVARFSIISIGIVLLLPGWLAADLWEYTFTGVLPEGASQHSKISDGESFVGRFVINSSAIDSQPDEDFVGNYLDAVIFGTLQFSGGYFKNGFTGSRVLVLDNVTGADAISVRTDSLTSNASILVQANSEDLDTIVGDAMLGPGNGFDSWPKQTEIERYQLIFGDDFGLVFFFGNVSHNVSFHATHYIPEPSAVLLLAGGSLLLMQRRRR